MPPRQLPPSTTSSPVSLSSWPIIKYSYSVSSPSSPTQSPWTHFTHRDNVFLVIDNQRVPGYIQNDGKFCDQQMKLKIVWGLETLESLDLTSLAQQITPARDPQQPNKPAFVALGRSPSLAIRYFKTEDQTIHRFQIKFLSDTAYQSATVLLERANCPVGNPSSISRDGTKYDISSQAQMHSKFPQFNHVQIQQTPPGTSSGYSNTSVSSGGTLGGESHFLRSTFPYLNDTPLTRSYDLAISDTIMTGISTSMDFSEPSRVPQKSSHSNLSYSYLPSVIESSNEPLEDLPPPRPPLGFGPRGMSNSPSTNGSKISATNLISNLPPLPKPTPTNRPLSNGLSVALSHNKDTSKYQESRFASSNSLFGIDTFRMDGDSPSTLKRRVGAYRPGLPGIIEEYAKSNSSKGRVSFPIFPYGYKKPEPEPCAPYPSSSKREKSMGIGTIGTGDTSTEGKRKQGSDEEGGQGQKKKQKSVLEEDESPCGLEEEEFRQIESFIVDAIHDDDFLRFVERIGGVWQRMVFGGVGKNFFSTDVSDRV